MADGEPKRRQRDLCLFYGSMPREDADPQVDPLCSHHLWREGALGGASVGQGAAFTTLCAVDGAARLGAHTAVIASFLHALTKLTRPSILWSPDYCLGRVACSGGI